MLSIEASQIAEKVRSLERHPCLILTALVTWLQEIRETVSDFDPFTEGFKFDKSKLEEYCNLFVFYYFNTTSAIHSLVDIGVLKDDGQYYFMPPAAIQALGDVGNTLKRPFEEFENVSSKLFFFGNRVRFSFYLDYLKEEVVSEDLIKDFDTQLAVTLLDLIRSKGEAVSDGILANLRDELKGQCSKGTGADSVIWALAALNRAREQSNDA